MYQVTGYRYHKGEKIGGGVQNLIIPSQHKSFALTFIQNWKVMKMFCVCWAQGAKPPPPPQLSKIYKKSLGQTLCVPFSNPISYKISHLAANFFKFSSTSSWQPFKWYNYSYIIILKPNIIDVQIHISFSF